MAYSRIFSEVPERNASFIFGCVWGGKNDGHIFNCLPLKGFDHKRKVIGLKIYFNAENCSCFVTTEGCLLGKPFFQYIRFKEEVRFMIKSVWSPRIMNHLTWRAINTVNRVLKSGTFMLSTELRLGQILNVVIKLIHFSVLIC